MVDVVDPLKMRVFHQGHFIKARHHLAHVLERRLQRTEHLCGRARAHVFVVVEDGETVLVDHRHHGFGKAVVVPCSLCAALRFHGERVCVLTAKPVFGGDDVCRNALGDEIGVHRDRRINSNRGTIAAHRNAAHHFNAARDICHTRAALDLVCGKVHGFHARGAEPVDGKAGDRLIKVRGQNCSARQTAALFANLGHVAPDHVFNRVTIKAIAVFQCVQHICRQTGRGHFVQAAVFAALAPRRSDRVVNIGFGHSVLLRPQEMRGASNRMGVSNRAGPQCGRANGRYWDNPCGRTQRVRGNKGKHSRTDQHW